VVRRRRSHRPRALARPLAVHTGSRILTVPVTRPFCAPALLAYLRVRVIAGIESVEGLCYRRTLRLKGAEGVLSVDLGQANRKGTVAVHYSPSLESTTEDVLKAVNRLVDAAAPAEEIAMIMGRDPIIGPLASRHPGVRIPGTVDPFELAVRAILGQQISVAAATTLAGKVANAWGTSLPATEGDLSRIFPDASRLADAPLETVGLSRAKAVAIRHLAAAVAEQRIDLTPMKAGEPAPLETLLGVPGIGPWTASYIGLRALGDPDAIPIGDLGLRQASGCETSREFAELSEFWRPWRGYAAVHLWCTFLDLET
jgi:AraC family transcriptional regulator of adaptative response / DNA-3-methyladenine glycosylase II